MLRMLTVCIAFVLVPSLQSAQTLSQLPSGLDFPPQDHRLWALQRQGLATKLARKLLAGAPADPAVLRVLIEDSDSTRAEILATLRQIVETRPDRVAEALEIIGPDVGRWQFDDTKGHVDAFRAIVAAAQAMLRDLSREDAARTARLLLNVEEQLCGNRRIGRPHSHSSFRSTEEHRLRCLPRSIS